MAMEQYSNNSGGSMIGFYLEESPPPYFFRKTPNEVNKNLGLEMRVKQNPWHPLNFSIPPQ